jgi:hypothetical protein
MYGSFVVSHCGFSSGPVVARRSQMLSKGVHARCGIEHSVLHNVVQKSAESMIRFPRTTSVWIVWASLSVVGYANQAAVTNGRRKRASSPQQQQQRPAALDAVSIAFVGNSMLFMNDCPRLVQQMIAQVLTVVTQDSCLRGGSTLTSLWEKGNGMSQVFATEQALMAPPSGVTDELNSTAAIPGPVYDVGAASVQELLFRANASWDFVILNDHTQGPARPASRTKSQKVLRRRYAPLLQRSVPIIVQTPAYRKRGIRDSADLGDFGAFTDQLAYGVQSYANTLRNAGIGDVRIAPVGEAYRYLHRHNPDLWTKLYRGDDFHPSPHGTWLQACVIYCTCFGRLPPVYNGTWWDRSRFVPPPEEMPPLPFPTDAEALELRRVACLIFSSVGSAVTSDTAACLLLEDTASQ